VRKGSKIKIGVREGESERSERGREKKGEAWR